MKFIAPVFTILTMALSTVLPAQKKQVQSVNWCIAATLPAAKGNDTSLGFAGPVAGVHNHVLFVGGGANFPDSMPWLGGKKKYYDEVYVYFKRKGKITLYEKTFSLPATIAYPANCSVKNGVVYIGGENENGISNKVWLMHWSNEEQKVIFVSLPDLPTGLSNAAATVYKNTLYVAGGETAAAASAQFYSLNLNNTEAGWEILPPVPKPVSHTVLAVQSNGKYPCIYLAGGRKKTAGGISHLYAFLYEFDLKKKQWKEKTPLPYSLCAGTGLPVGTDALLMLGGDKGTTFHKVETFIAAINTENDEIKKQALIKQKNILQSTHPGFSKEMLLYSTTKNIWKTIGSIPFDVPATTSAFLWGKDIIIPSGEIRAGVRSPQILLGKINFKSK